MNKLLYLLPILLVAGCIEGGSLTGFVTGASEDPEMVQVSLGINNGKILQVEMISVLQGTTALEAFDQIAELQTSEFNGAAYVTAINGLPEDPHTNTYWMFFVNNEMAMVGVSGYIISEPTNLEFRYESLPAHE